MVDMVNEVNENEYLKNSVIHIYAFENTRVVLRERLKHDKSTFMNDLTSYSSEILDKPFDYKDILYNTSLKKYIDNNIDIPAGEFFKNKSDNKIQNTISVSFADYLDHEMNEFIDYMIKNHESIVPHVCMIDKEFADKLFRTIKDKPIYDDLVKATVYISIPLSDNISVNVVDQNFLYFISDEAGSTIAKPNEHPISKRLATYMIKYTYENKLDSLIKEYKDDERSIREGIKYINNLS